MKLLQFLIVFCYCTVCFTAGNEEKEETLNKNPAPDQEPEQGFTGTTHETKTQDGSTLTVTHFKGQLPQGSFPGSHSHPAFPGWAFPGSPFFNPWVSPVTPAGTSPENSDKKHSKRDSKTNNAKGQQQKDSSTSTTQSLNVTLPFSKRYPPPPRYSTKFHYPELPEVYWQHHKRPFVPLLDPELYGFNDVEGDIKQDL